MSAVSRDANRSSLSSPDPEERRRAVRALGETPDPLAVAALVSFLRDEAWPVQMAAADALAQAGELAVEPLVAAMADADPRVRAGAVSALAKIGWPALRALTKALAETNPEVRRGAVQALARIRDDRALEPLLKALDDRYPPVRAGAVSALAALGDRRAVEPAAQRLRDPDASVRSAAALALGALGDPRAAGALAEALKDRDPRVRRAAARSLADAGDGSVLTPLLSALGDPDPEVRERTAQALGRLGSDRAVEPLARALRDSDPGVRASSAEALGRLRKGRAREFLVSALEDREPAVRAQAAEALGGMGDELAAQPLAARLGDSDERVRAAVAWALGFVGGAGTADHLVSALADVDASVRARAADALGRLRDQRAVPALIRVLADPDASARRSAAGALGRAADPGAVDPLIARLMDSAPDVRLAAARSLGQIGEPAVGALVASLRWAPPDMRSYAVEALSAVGEPAATRLLDALRDENASVRREARSALLLPLQRFLSIPAGSARARGGPWSAADGTLAAAREGLARTAAHLEQLRGPRYPEVARVLNDLSLVSAAQGDGEAAVRLARQARDIEEYNFSLVLVAGSDAERQAYAEQLDRGISATISLHTRHPDPSPEAGPLALRTVLRRKGRALDALAYSLAGLRERLGPRERELLEQWTALLERESSARHGPQEHEGGPGPAEILARRQEIEQELRGFAGVFGRIADLPSVEDVQLALPDDAALVEMVTYEPVTWRSREAPRYAAYVLRRQGKPGFVDLGEAAALDSAATRLLQVLGKSRRRWGATERALSRAVYDQAFAPLACMLEGTKHLVFSADGLFNLVPLGALQDDEGRFLVERFRISCVTTGRDLTRLKTLGAETAPALVLAGPDYDAGAPPGRAEERSSRPGPRSADLSGVTFAPLRGAAEEGNSLARLLPGSVIRVGAEATEAALKAARRPRILHVATHGFFLSDPVNPAGDLAAEPESPLVRAGLAFAGANLRRSGGEDGVLTALEATGLDLRGTELVVLSACETGTGEVRNGEGVYGLRRAFAVAGAQAQLTTLWRVSDEAGRSFAEAYYRRLLDGEGRAEALRQVQLEMLRSGTYTHPFYWAGFVAVGDWRPLGGSGWLAAADR